MCVGVDICVNMKTEHAEDSIRTTDNVFGQRKVSPSKYLGK